MGNKAGEEQNVEWEKKTKQQKAMLERNQMQGKKKTLSAHQWGFRDLEEQTEALRAKGWFRTPQLISS